MEVKRFISKIPQDGRLILPKDTAKESGKIVELILIPFSSEVDIYSYAENLAKEKSFSSLTEVDVKNIIHKSRGKGGESGRG